jgi:uncharacterized membrane protein
MLIIDMQYLLVCVKIIFLILEMDVFYVLHHAEPVLLFNLMDVLDVFMDIG